MKTKILVLMCSFLLIGTYLFAGDGDLIVNGNVGIGTTSPGFKLDVTGAIRATTNIRESQLVLNSIAPSDQSIVGIAFSKAGNYKWMGGVSESDEFTLYDVKLGKHAIYACSAGNFFFFPTGGGNIGIGSWNASEKLTVQGYIYASSGYKQSSDKKYKKDIVPIESALEKVMNIEGVSFNWDIEKYKEKNFPKGKHFGLVAQDIEKFIPEIVETVKFKHLDKDFEEEEKAISYTELIPILIEAIKEQQAEIEELKQTIAKLNFKK